MKDIEHMNSEVIKDVKWFLNFLELFNGTCSYIYTPVNCTDVIELDACLTGLGGRFNNQVYKYQFRNNEVPQSFSIVHLEMWNVLIGISQSWGLTSRSTARVILGQVLRIATCGTRTHRGDSL